MKPRIHPYHIGVLLAVALCSVACTMSPPATREAERVPDPSIVSARPSSAADMGPSAARVTPSLTPAPSVECGLVCQDATASARITPGTPPPTTEEYARQEKAWADHLATLAASTSTPTATATPTATPPVSESGTPGFLVFRGVYHRSREGPQGPSQVTFPASDWTPVTPDMKHRELHHTKMPGCILQFDPQARGVGPPLIRDSVRRGEFTWSRLTIVQEESIVYTLDLADSTVMIELKLGAPVTSEEGKGCQAAGEGVLATFALGGTGN